MTPNNINLSLAKNLLLRWLYFVPTSVRLTVTTVDTVATLGTAEALASIAVLVVHRVHIRILVAIYLTVTPIS